MSFNPDSFDVNAFSNDAFDFVESVMNPFLMKILSASSVINIIKKKL